MSLSHAVISTCHTERQVAPHHIPEHNTLYHPRATMQSDYAEVDVFNILMNRLFSRLKASTLRRPLAAGQ